MKNYRAMRMIYKLSHNIGDPHRQNILSEKFRNKKVDTNDPTL